MRVVHSLCHEPGKKTAFKTLQCVLSHPFHPVLQCKALHGRLIQSPLDRRMRPVSYEKKIQPSSKFSWI
jgi:hypothetical protein